MATFKINTKSDTLKGQQKTFKVPAQKQVFTTKMLSNCFKHKFHSSNFQNIISEATISRENILSKSKLVIE